MIQIYHNTRCGKSRNCLAFLEKSNLEFEIINYLVNVPSYENLTELLLKLNFKPSQLIRQKEQIWIAQYKSKNLTDNEIIAAMIANPILIERPILVFKDKAIIARETTIYEQFLTEIKNSFNN